MVDKHHKPDDQRSEEILRFGQSPAYRQDLFCDADNDDQNAASENLHDELILPFDKTLIVAPQLAELVALHCDYDGMYMQGRKKKPSAKVRNQQMQALALLVLHCVSAYGDLGDCPVAIPANASGFGNTGLRQISTIGYDAFISARDMLLVSRAMCILKNGNVNSYNGKGRVSLYYAPRDFLGWIISALPDDWREQVTRSPYIETILLRSSGATRKLLNYPETSQSQQQREHLSQINRANTEAILSLDAKALAEVAPDIHQRYQHIDRSLMRYADQRRIFNNDSWAQGGRFYGGWWQKINKELRPYILIDGCPSVEADFKALHPSLLYHSAGLNMPSDPYDPDFIGCPDVDRKYIKKAFNALINTSSTVREPQGYGTANSGTSWGDLLKQIETAHASIKGAFRSGQGLFLQHTDSNIAEMILLHFARQGKPCLPIHDSFVVRQDDLGELIAVMKGAAKEVAGIEAVVTVKHGGDMH